MSDQMSLGRRIAPPDEAGWLAGLLPAAQPLGCIVFLLAGRLLEDAAPGAAVWSYALAYLSGGAGSAVAAWASVRRFRIDVNVLMLIAAAGAAYLGAWAEGSVLLFLFSVSNALEYYIMGRTRRAIRSLMSLRPAEATVRRDGAEVTIPAGTLKIGDIIIVRPAERLSADGVVVDGESAVDQSPITGESIPVDVAAGSVVFAGTINQRGSLDVRVTHDPEDTVLSRIIALVEQAQAAQPPAQRLIDRYGQAYAVVVILGSACTYGVLTWLGWPAQAAFYRAITLLVVASPCAVVISTPATMLSAITKGARHGVLFKGGVYLEQLGRVDTIVFDKTGTLTVGRPVVTDVVPVDGDETALLATAAALEQRSEHALADTIVAAARARGIGIHEPRAFASVTGRGVRGVVSGRMVRVGSEAFMREEGVPVPGAASARVHRLRQEGKTPILVAGDHLLGVIAVADSLRPEAARSVRALRALGVRRLMLLTGDHRQSAEAVARFLGLDEARAELLPEQKAQVVEALGKEGAVAMIGDGVNDAPALTAASVGIAMGAAGTDAAMETADVVLMGDDLGRLPYAIGLSRQARRVVAQNLIVAGVVIAVLIAAVLLFGLRLAFGVVGHEGSTVVVVLNGLRLLAYRVRPAGPPAVPGASSVPARRSEAG